MDIDEMSAVGLSQAQQEGLQKLLPILGPKGVKYIIAQCEEKDNKRIHLCLNLVEHVKAQMFSSAPSPKATMAQGVVRRPNPIQMEVDKFDGKEGDNLMLWFRQVVSDMFIADITYEPYRVGFATGKLGGLAKQWAFTCGASLQDATWADLKVQMTRSSAPPNQAPRNSSRLLACRQGKSELAAYVQELRTLIAAMVIDPMPEAVTVTVFMEGFRVALPERKPSG
ncbi:unnamed protein product [Peronospora belbahrii]|uniref:Retrotransposon gag domain-containing protein n=1 Tax=Peronospora belbahrii TaxID=622444 RepID=A0AAU9L2C8_9STRA|nr:unnamed protein product [Peronospora belbahrii]